MGLSPTLAHAVVTILFCRVRRAFRVAIFSLGVAKSFLRVSGVNKVSRSGEKKCRNATTNSVPCVSRLRIVTGIQVLGLRAREEKNSLAALRTAANTTGKMTMRLNFAQISTIGLMSLAFACSSTDSDLDSDRGDDSGSGGSDDSGSGGSSSSSGGSDASGGNTNSGGSNALGGSDAMGGMGGACDPDKSSCSPICTDECSTLDETSCAETSLQKCVTGANGCLEWSTTEECTGICDDLKGAQCLQCSSDADCVDDDECTINTCDKAGACQEKTACPGGECAPKLLDCPDEKGYVYPNTSAQLTGQAVAVDGQSARIELTVGSVYPYASAVDTLVMPNGSLITLTQAVEKSSNCPNAEDPVGCTQVFTFVLDTSKVCKLDGKYVAKFDYTCAAGGDCSQMDPEVLKHQIDFALASEDFCP